jgi:hypothetical protein
MREFIGGLVGGLVIPGLIILTYWLEAVLHDGRLKIGIVAAVVGTTVGALWLTIVLSPLTAKYVLPPYALLFLLSWFYYKRKQSKRKPPSGGPCRRVPAQAKGTHINLGTEGELTRDVAEGRNGTFRGR